MGRKIFSTEETVSQFIEDGDSIAMGTALETAIPFAIGYEVIYSLALNCNKSSTMGSLPMEKMEGLKCPKYF